MVFVIPLILENRAKEDSLGQGHQTLFPDCPAGVVVNRWLEF